VRRDDQAWIVGDPGAAQRDVEPSLIDQTATHVASSHCRWLGLAPAIGHSAPTAPRESPDGIDSAGIAGALLHQPGPGHQDRQRHRDRGETP
jgi:hypothetical protein